MYHRNFPVVMASNNVQYEIEQKPEEPLKLKSRADKIKRTRTEGKQSMASTASRFSKIENEGQSELVYRRVRRSRCPLTGAVGRIRKFFSLFDGSTTVKCVLQRAFDAVFAPDTAAIISYSTEHSVEALLDSSQAIFERFVTWSEMKMVVSVEDIQVLASSVIEYVIHVQQSAGKSMNKTGSMSYCSASRTFVCTATLQHGKILSCIEKKVGNIERRDAEDDETKTESMSRDTNEDSLDNSLSALSCGSYSSTSASEFCKGTGLEDVEQRGGSIFINKNNTVTSITVVTEQDGFHQNLELIEVDDAYDAFDCNAPSMSFLLRDITTENHQDIVFCRPASPNQKRGTFYIDGYLPVVESDRSISQHEDVEFFPRYEFDQFSNHVFIWNGACYESYMNAFEDDSPAQSRQHLTRNDIIRFAKETDWSEEGQCAKRQDIVAHVSRSGYGSKNFALRARIKIPSGEDPALVICLFAIGCHSTSYMSSRKKFTKLRIHRNPTEPEDEVLHRQRVLSSFPAQSRVSPGNISKVSWILNERSSFDV